MIDHDELEWVTQRVTDWYMERIPWADPEDLKHEATCAVLRAAEIWDEGKRGTREEYLLAAASYAVRAYRYKVGSPVTGCSHRPEKLKGMTAVVFVERPQEEWTPEQEVHYARWRVQVRAELHDAMGDDREVAEPVLLEGEKPKAIAVKTGRPVEEIYQTLQRVRRRIRNTPTFWRLLKEIV